MSNYCRYRIRAGDIGEPERIIEAPEPVPETIPEPEKAPAEPAEPEREPERVS